MIDGVRCAPLAIDHAHDRAHPDRTLDADGGHQHTVTLTAIDDGIGW